MSYEDAAPDLAKFIDRPTFEAAFPAPADPPADPPEPNASKWIDLFNDYAAEWAANGGYVDLWALKSRHQGVKLKHCERLRDQVAAAYTELYGNP
jgi:hypothetical protein